MRRPALAYLVLGVVAFAFGSTFVVIKDAITELPPLSFVGWRFLIGSAALFVLAPWPTRDEWRDGLAAGSLLLAGFALQTLGLARTSASNSGLITGLYVVLTPLLVAGVRRRPPTAGVVVGSAASFVGLFVLTATDGLTVGSGDLLTLGCAVAFAAHIVVLARVAPRHRVLPFTSVQLLVTGVGSLAAGLVVDGFRAPAGTGLLAALVFTGLVVSAGAFSAQVWAQRIVGANPTAIVLSLEPLFAALTAAVVLGERIGRRGLLGAGLILAGIWMVLALSREEDAVSAAEAVSPAH